MMKMKRMYKRFLALVLAVTMVMSYGIAVSAVELDESPSPEDIIVEFDVDESSISEDGIFAVNINPNGDIMPLDDYYYINTSGSNMTTQSKYNESFSMVRTETLHIQLFVKGTCHIRVRIKLKGSLITSDFLNTTLTDAPGTWVSQDPITQKSDVTVTLDSFSTGAAYQLKVWSN